MHFAQGAIRAVIEDWSSLVNLADILSYIKLESPVFITQTVFINLKVGLFWQTSFL